MIEKALDWAEDHWGTLGAFIAMMLGFGRWNWALRDQVRDHGSRIAQLEKMVEKIFDKLDANTSAVHELIGELRGRDK